MCWNIITTLVLKSKFVLVNTIKEKKEEENIEF